MKKGLRAKLLAFALALCLCTTMVTPALAANGWRSNSGNRWSIGSWWNNRWNHGNDNTSNSDKSDSSSEPTLKLVEDQSTVAEGTNLRASTYEDTSNDTAADTSTIKYFPVTMYNYDKDTYNAALRNKEAAEANKNGTTLDKWKGLYFGPQKSDVTDTGSYTTEDGTAYAPTTTITSSGDTYYLVNYNSGVTNKLVSGTGLVALGSGTAGQSVAESALKNGTAWTITESGNSYTIKNAAGKYLAITGAGTGGVTLSDSAVTVDITPVNANGTVTISKQITSGRKTTTYYLNAYGGGNTTSLGGYTGGADDDGSNFYLYHKTNTAVTDALHYEDYNNWTGDLVQDTSTSKAANGNNTYSGLVNRELDKTQNIQLNETDIGMFRSDDTNNTYGKTIYTRVGLPFQYDKSTNYYTFDSNTMSAHFTTSNPAGSDTNLTYGTTPQTISNLSAQGKTDNTNSWLPFNTGSTATTSTADYYFGMQAAIPFSMTANGKMNANDETSEDIQFDFSGDDDVWVFVDGKLVLDLGGIHNELAGSMNFAKNTWSITKGDGNDTDVSTKPVGDVKNAAMSGKLFNDDNGTGVLGTDRTTFAATTSHTLTVFYLERGAGASNCKIKFNLPMEDSVSVTKQISKTDSANANISEDSWTSLNNHAFTFKLFKDDTPVANTNYSIVDESGQTVGTGTTTKDGTFTLKNNQTAKFVGQMLESGNTYYVTEVREKGWETPSSTYTATAANGYKETEKANGTTSAKVTMKGSDEANDKLDYTFTNTLTHTDKATVNPQDDRIVIDYGLPVEIDPLANDVAQNATMSIESVDGAKFGTATIENNKVVYKLNKQLTDVEVLTYTVKATATQAGDTDKTATAKIYIIPATSMYYEENFSDMVKFSSSWQNEGNAGTVYQEPGVVGTLNDSPYGSDNAYMTSTGDSNGTSKYVSTDDGKSKTFQYTFTGMGTSFFARTNNNSGYMRVRVKDASGSTITTLYRNTKYNVDKSDTLYNIPVFTWNADKYGTYTIEATIVKKDSAGNYGSEFWMDGIRVMNPINPSSENNQTAQDAYAADGENSMTFATLRNVLLNDTKINENDELVWDTSKGFAVFTDSNDNITSASEYKSNGPKEEVYLAKGQSVSFSLTNWNPDANHLYLGIKAPMGSGTVLLGSSQSIEINNTVDCYYDVAKLVTVTEVDGQKVATLKITNSSDKIISLTNIKVTGTPDFVIIPKKDIDVSGKDEASE